MGLFFKDKYFANWTEFVMAILHWECLCSGSQWPLSSSEACLNKVSKLKKEKRVVSTNHSSFPNLKFQEDKSRDILWAWSSTSHSCWKILVENNEEEIMKTWRRADASSNSKKQGIPSSLTHRTRSSEGENMCPKWECRLAKENPSKIKTVDWLRP